MVPGADEEEEGLGCCRTAVVDVDVEFAPVDEATPLMPFVLGWACWCHEPCISAGTEVVDGA